MRGYDNQFTLLDGGQQVVSEIAMYATDSQWTVENIGVVPSIPVHVNPGLLARRGEDTQLQTAVHVLLKEIQRAPVLVPPRPHWLPAFPTQPTYPTCPSSTGTCQ